MKKEKSVLRSSTASDKIYLTFVYIILAVALILVLFPCIFILSAAISDPMAVQRGEVILFPKGITFEGYTRVFKNDDILMGYRNTIFYTIVGTMINLAVTFCAAYPLTRKDLKGKGLIVIFFTIPMFFSGGLIPSYLWIKDLHLLDSIFFMLITGSVSLWNLVMVRTYITTTIPHELEESAFMDGASDLRVFISIIIPLCGPIIAVMALFYGVGHWNDYFTAMIYMSTREKFPLQLFLREILIQNQVAASSLTNSSSGDLLGQAAQARIVELIKYSTMIVSTVPVLIVYPFVQKFFVKGMMVGAIKG